MNVFDYIYIAMGIVYVGLTALSAYQLHSIAKRQGGYKAFAKALLSFKFSDLK